MHDISLQESSNPSGHGLNTIDLIPEQTEVENCQARLIAVQHSHSSQVAFKQIQLFQAHSLFVHSVLGS